ncbi:uncharacterized protein isoform X1 [Danio rerio]|uniref:Uncharacterized protein isoform X1 n=2 Tax=Danio rerio TaxID=7955 RepID=A0AC58FX94_DANRE|nr:uncharacterized protein LOC100536854 precursor [Danio rerio]
MTKPICLVFALLILTIILCNNSVCSQRRSMKQSAVCGCKLYPDKGLKCTKRPNPKSRDEYYEILKCICRDTQIFSKSSRKEYLKRCNKFYPSLPL